MLNRHPDNAGHERVIPRVHAASLTGLAPEVFDRLHAPLRLAVQAVGEVHAPGGLQTSA